MFFIFCAVDCRCFSRFPQLQKVRIHRSQWIVWLTPRSVEKFCHAAPHTGNYYVVRSPLSSRGFMIDSCCDSINRKILNDLSSDAPAVPRIEEEKAEEDSSSAAPAAPAITTVTVPTPIYQTSSGQYSRWSVWDVCYLIFTQSMPFCLLWVHESSD